MRRYISLIGCKRRSHVVLIDLLLQLSVSVGRTSFANATVRPEITLVFPPVEEGGFSLVVDATAESGAGSASGSGATAGLMRLTATWAVLHRPAP